MSNMKIILTAGGTGGHIFPAMAVANEIREKYPESELLWITTNRSNEKEIAERFSLKMLSLDVDGIQRKISLQPLKAILKTIKAINYMKKFLKKEKPDAVIAFGGYVCASVLWAAKSAKIPYFIQEQNTIMGAVNKFFVKGANFVFLGMPIVEKHTPSGDNAPATPLKAGNFHCQANENSPFVKGWQGCYPLTGYVLSGTPVRKKENYDNFAYPAEIDKNKRTILICGGSQGAQSMNNILVKAVRWFSQNGFQVIWQTGTASEGELKKEFSDDKNVAVFASFTDLYPYYSIADLLIGRAGAGTISEAELFALPSIFIPLPWSAENHQWHNAGWAENCGWALRFEQNGEASEKIIAFAEKNLVEKGEFYEKMKNCAVKNSKNSAEIIVQKVFSLKN